jgi:DNA-3-methyladenine glycosylase
MLLKDKVGRAVDAAFFDKPTLELSKALLGMELIHETNEGVTSGIITEVEAYCGVADKGCHSYGGRRTKRTEVMFGPPGYAYVYFIYGMYYCFNVVSGEVGSPEAILVRALKPIQGIPLMARRRGMNIGETDSTRRLTNLHINKLTGGPGRLAQAMGITKEQYGWNLSDSSLYIGSGSHAINPKRIVTGPRINIDYAEEAKDYPWRFWV